MASRKGRVIYKQRERGGLAGQQYMQSKGGGRGAVNDQQGEGVGAGGSTVQAK
jgi:hypothetical protein